MAEFSIRVAPPREHVSSLTTQCYAVGLITATDDFLDAQVFEMVHALRLWISDHTAALNVTFVVLLGIKSPLRF